MYVTLVHVHVKPERVEEFIAATKPNHEGSVKEATNHRFDILQSIEEPTRFVLYEAYESEEGAREHKKTEHYLKWKEAVADWMASPREGVRYDGLLPRVG